MGAGHWFDRVPAAGSDMRSKQIPTSRSSVRLAALFPPLGAGAGAGGDGKGLEPEEEPRGTSPLGPGGPYACAHCGGCYPTQQQLERHETLHSPSTQTCKICQKSFANVYRLQRHMISHDDNASLRKYKCNDCDKAFKFKHHLKEHLRIHSGEKPFECANCGKRFSHSGSYSSHMTSKKCLIMNLKMGRIKPNNPALNPDRSPSRKRPSAALVASQLNNNIPPNGNAFLSMLPKYRELFSAMPLDANFTGHSPLTHNFHPFYMPPGMSISPASGITPYSIPASFTDFLEQIASSQYKRKKVEDECKDNGPTSDAEDLIEEVTEEDDKRSSVSSAHDLVMDIDEDEVAIKKEREDDMKLQSRLSNPSHISDGERDRNLGGLHMILETVNASVTKHLLHANMQKLSPVSGNTCPIVEMPNFNVAVKPDPEESYFCVKCQAIFSHKSDLAHHEQSLCGNMFRKHESLAAQVAETVALNRIEAEFCAIQSGVSASEDEDYSKDDSEIKSSNDSERKIRVRTAISEEQQAKLKEYYAINQRPNREDFKRIAQQLGLDNRVVQVWFQNNRARVRRMNQNSSMPTDQPLDLSTKKVSMSVTSSPPPSPPCGISMSHSESGEEAVNLSQKSSRSTTPHRSNYHNAYPHSNCSSSSFDFRQSPSPAELQRRDVKPLVANVLMSPMEKMLQHNGYNGNALLNMHLSDGRLSSSPGYDRRSWSEDMAGYTELEDPGMKVKGKMGAEGREAREAEGLYVCDQCDKSFVKQSSLARHKYEHSGQRPYKCLECPKAFKHKHHLTEHKRLHTGEKPFKCPKCDKKFSHSGSFSQHMNHRSSFCKPYRE